MSCASSTLKFFAFVLNLLCFISGGFILGASSYSLNAFNSTDAIFIPCIIGIVIGSLLFLSSFVGWWATLRESIRSCWLYVIVLGVLLAAQVAINLLIPVDFAKLAHETITSAWDHSISDTNSMAHFEIKYECCGKNGPQDYEDSGLIIPSSCYQNQNTTSTQFSVGCANALSKYYSTSAQIEEITDWSLVGLEGVTVLVHSWMAITFRNIKRRDRYR